MDWKLRMGLLLIWSQGRVDDLHKILQDDTLLQHLDKEQAFPTLRVIDLHTNQRHIECTGSGEIVLSSRRVKQSAQGHTAQK